MCQYIKGLKIMTPACALELIPALAGPTFDMVICFSRNLWIRHVAMYPPLAMSLFPSDFRFNDNYGNVLRYRYIITFSFKNLDFYSYSRNKFDAMRGLLCSSNQYMNYCLQIAQINAKLLAI